MMIEKPVLNGNTDKENLHILETWAGNLIDELNYVLSHLEETNFVPDVMEKLMKIEKGE